MRIALGLLLACALAQGVAADPAATGEDATAQKVGQSLVDSFQTAVQRARDVPAAHLHTVNARNLHFDRSSEGPPPGVGRQITVHSTAYCLRGFTARGTSVEYGTVAVDPRLIPLGSQLYIPGYGWGRALDTGGAVRGATIDLWFPTIGQCFQWGGRSVTITVIDKR